MKYDRGSSTLEFAMCIPALLLFIGSICVLLIIGNYQLKCANAVNEVLRVAITYDEPTAGEHQGEYRNLISEVLGADVGNSANLEVNTQNNDNYVKVKIRFAIPKTSITTIPRAFVGEISSESVGKIER